ATAGAVLAHSRQLPGRGRTDRGVLPGGGRADRGMLPGGRAAQRATVDGAQVDGVVAGRRDQRLVDRGPVQGAFVLLATGDPAARLHPQVMLDVRLDDHHVDVVP